VRSDRGAPAVPLRRIALVLGGGGLKGFAHIGVLNALAEHGIVPSLLAGSSIGALFGAAHVTGMSTDEMARRASTLQRRDLFRMNHVEVLMSRMKARSIYLEEPLRALVESVIPDVGFEDLSAPLLVNTVDIVHGTQVVWGLPGLRDVSVRDAVYASCALPFAFPPGRVDGRVCVDGGTVDNLPVRAAGVDVDAIIAVDVGNADLPPAHDIMTQGFASIYLRAASTMMHTLQQFPLEHWQGPPMLLVRPKIAHIDWFAFSHTPELIAAGYRATMEALAQAADWLAAPSGIYPRRAVQVEVDRDKCVGCGLCVALAPKLMGLDSSGKAFARTRYADWSPADGDFVGQCPTLAITATDKGAVTTPLRSATGR
jgi:NTE family protein